MSMTMLGLLSCATPDPTTPRSVVVAISSDKPRVIRFRFILWVLCCYLVWVSEESLVFPIEQPPSPLCFGEPREGAEEIEQLFFVLSVCRVKPVVRRAVVYPV